MDVGGKRAEALLVHELRRHRHRQVRAAVERPVEDDDAGPPGGGACDLHGVLDRLRPGVEEQGFRGRASRPELVELLGDRDVGLVEADHEALVQIAVDLLVDGLDYRLGVVAEVLASDAAREIEVLTSVGVPDRRPFGAGDGHVRRRDSSRHVSIAPGADGRRVLDLFRRHRSKP